jgi:phenylpyruvate tautomerase PptA (4-oxalocrotonate tautomerase family)
MPYLQLDVSNRYPVKVKRCLARRLGITFARIMQTSPELVIIAFRELGEGGVWSCGQGEPEPYTILPATFGAGGRPNSGPSWHKP